MGIVSSAKLQAVLLRSMTIVVSIPDGDSFLREEIHFRIFHPSSAVSIPDGDSFLREATKSDNSAQR